MSITLYWYQLYRHLPVSNFPLSPEPGNLVPVWSGHRGEVVKRAGTNLLHWYWTKPKQVQIALCQQSENYVVAISIFICIFKYQLNAGWIYKYLPQGINIHGQYIFLKSTPSLTNLDLQVFFSLPFCSPDPFPIYSTPDRSVLFSSSHPTPSTIHQHKEPGFVIISTYLDFNPHLIAAPSHFQSAATNCTSLFEKWIPLLYRDSRLWGLGLEWGSICE